MSKSSKSSKPSKSISHKSATSKISQSRKWVTIVFTDIVDSTRHWDEMGDVETRYRVQQHDQNLIPLVTAYGGEVVKTIGDSIMASFSEPDNAVRSAIAMQHALHEIREKDPEFQLKVRIGIHRGKALVEEDDIFGNTVNVASRVEDEARGDEILISDAVLTSLDREQYHLTRRGSFVPRGKTNSILLYRVSWWRTDSVLECIPNRRNRKLLRRRFEIISYPVLAAAALLVAAVDLAPLLLQSRPGWQSLALNPNWALEFQPELCLYAAGALVAALAAPLLLRSLRSAWLSGLRGFLAFAAGFAMLQLAGNTLPIQWPGEFRHALEIEGLSLVEINESDVALRSTPSRDSPTIALSLPGQRLPLVKTAATRSAGKWFRVAIAPDLFGWLPARGGTPGRAASHEIVPARFRVLELLDLYAAGWGAVLALAVVVRTRRSKVRLRPASLSSV